MSSSLEGSRHVQPTLKEWKLCSASLRAEYRKLLKFFCMEYLSLSPTYLFIQSIISVRTNRCLFYTSLFNMLLKLFQFGHWEFLQLAPMSLWLISIIVGLFVLLVWTLLYLLALKDASGSSCILPAPLLESVISPRVPGSFYWKMLLKNKIWALDALIAAGVLLLLSLLNW